MTTAAERKVKREMRVRKQKKIDFACRLVIDAVKLVITAAAALLTAGLLLGLMEYAPPRVRHLVIIAAAVMVALWMMDRFFFSK